MNDRPECPHCGNKTGFAFGTCCQCGFNYLDHTFHSICVRPEDLPAEMREWAVARHARTTRKREA
jgi:hypothetical protein